MNGSLLMQSNDGFGHMDGWGGGWMWVWGTLMTFATVLAIVWLVRIVAGRSEGPNTPSDMQRARSILAERYARGELTTEEYRERLEQLT
jgi:putative membrane protein